MTRYASGVYPGESLDKRAARLWLYRQATACPRVGSALALAGTEPRAEMLLLRDYLRWPGERTWIVDWAKHTETRAAVLAGLADAAAQWPRAHIRQANICDIVRQQPKIGFANLDFMGQMDRTSMQPCIRDTVARLLIDGVMGVTWFRGRERLVENHSSWDIFEAAKRSGIDNPRDGLNRARWAGVLQLVEEWAYAAGVRLEVIGAIEYQHRHSPMSVTAWRRTA